MADFTKTITVAVRVFADEPPTRFGQTNGFPYTMVWGTAKWGSEGNSIILDFQKLVTNSTGLAPDTVIIAGYQKIISDNVVVSMLGNPTDEKLSQGSWQYIFVDGVANAQSRSFVTWTQASAQTTSFTCGAAATTNWS